MRDNVLSQREIEHFIECGWVKLEEAFTRVDALAVQDVVWGHVEKLGILRNDRSTWGQDMVHLKETYDDDPVQRCMTPRFAGAVEDLVGAGRWRDRVVYGECDKRIKLGWWPVNFAKGAELPWTVPTNGWHWDGIFHRHTVDSPHQGLLCLCTFSEVGPRGGGTLIAEGSHKIVAKLLAGYPEGIEIQEAIATANRSHPWLSELTRGTADGITEADAAERVERFMNRVTVDEDGVRLRVVEAVAAPGDVYLCHPFLYHTASQNHSGIPRFMCNKGTPLTEPMKFDRANASEYSPLELSIRRVIHKLIRENGT